MDEGPVWTPKMKNKLLKWFEEDQRPLPWRKGCKPYHILISEVMLQQTTVASVVPYYKRFIKRFPTLRLLASASEPDVIEYWAGLGYYSRARNLLKTVKEIRRLKRFPRSYLELMSLPGLGPYTSRAVSSIAFGESVGVLDGNVIRVLCRLYNLEIQWWKSAERKTLQDLADQAVQGVDSSRMNQAMMELGSTICMSQSPSCLICPLLGECQSQKAGNEKSLPLSRPKRKREIWVWRPLIYKRRNEIGFVKNDYAPFLNGQLVLPGSAQRQQCKPKKYDFRHSITHHDIYIQTQKINKTLKGRLKSADIKWVKTHEVAKIVPSSLVKKTLDH